MTKLSTVGAFLLIFAGITAAPAQGLNGLAPSSWPHARYDMALTARAQVAGPNLPQLQWTIAIGAGQLGQPVTAADGTIYIPGNENDVLYAITPDGQLLWSFTGKKLDDEQFVAPAVVGRDGVIYFGSTKNIFYAVNPDGSLRWTQVFEGPVLFSGNIGNDGTIYVAAQDCQLYAITPDGKIKWRINLNRFPGNGPAISSDGTIYVVAGELLKGFTQDGSLRLEVGCGDLGMLYGLVVDGSATIYVTGEIPQVRAIGNDGATRWEYSFPESFGAPRAPALGKDRSLYFASAAGGEIFVLNHDGTKRWSYSQASAPYRTALALDDSNNVYIVHDEHGLTSLSAAGQLRWTMPEVDGEFSPGFGADGTLYIGSDKKLYAIGAPSPKMAVEPARLDWGEVCVGSSIARTLKITNTGNADLQVNALVLANSTFQVESKNFVLAPGSHQIVEVKFTPTALAPFSETLVIDSNAGSAAVTLQGRGICQQILSATDSLFFGDVVIGKSATKFLQILTAGACELRFDSLQITGADAAMFAADSADLSKIFTENDTAKFAIRFSPAHLGIHRAALWLYSQVHLRNPLIVFLQGNGVPARPEIEVAPLALEFGKICSEGQLYAVIANIGDGALQVDSLVFSNAAFSTDHAGSFSVAAGERDTIRIRCALAAGGEATGTLSIFSDDPNEKSVAVELRGSGGFADVAGLNEVDFGTVAVQACAGLSTAAVQTYVIRNEGSCDLRIDSLSTWGDFSIVSPNVPQYIAAGGILEVSLKFTPLATGDHVGTLRVVSNDPDERVLVIALRGRGAASSDIVVAPDTLDFGSVAVGTKKDAALNIRNLGSAPLNVSRLEISSPRFTTASQQFELTCKQDSAVTITFAPDSMGVFTATLAIASNDPDEAIAQIVLRGGGTKLVHPLIAADSLAYHFPPICLGSLDSLSAVITNNGNVILRVDSVRVASNRQIFFVDAAGFALGVRQSKTLAVFFKPAARGQYATSLQFFSNAANGRLFEVGLRGAGSAPEIAGLAQLNFAPTKLDSSRRETYLVNNAGDCALRVTNVSIEGAQANEFKILDAGATIIAPQESSPVILEFKPSVSSARQAILVITSSDPARPRFEVALNGNGNGLPGKLAGPNAIGFGEACIDESVTRECTLTNTGQSDLTITRLATGRGEFFQISGSVPLPKRLAPQQALVIPLAFAPKRLGDVRDTLFAQTDLLTSPTFRVALQGAGRDDLVRLDFSHLALAFSGHLDEPKTESLTITNSGCAQLEISQIELARKLRVFTVRPEIPLPVLLEKNASLKVTVVFKGDDFRAFADSLYVYCLDWQQSPERRSVSLLGKVMDGAPCLQVSDSQLNFGAVAVGQAKRLDLEVTNCSADSRMIIRTIQPASADFRALPDTLTIFPGNPQFFAVNFSPRQNGEIVDTLKLAYYTLTDPGQQQIQKIVLRGTGSGNRAFAMPNAFTPNGDGKNDQAKIHFAGYDPEVVVLRVYDLRGLEVRLLRPARRGELEIGWDGRNDSGALQLPGAYLWLLEDNGKKVGSGQIVLIR
jgi:outer membrane protein assembly factor BamB